ncbi:hypothetical protein HELRODRAFT_164975 [Helobdella robusta]|uniref:Uncharacterized protein n=1 Tax=Helobdella robusta TaxID=6412 RepID=T1EW19_HELRO|nr:hypothetical protein HELRODRAFT_164975 [Helobdella robusta]ESN92845.1 hypothetical protein HELRODRAFT_164975 [Helobdella robusta]
MLHQSLYFQCQAQPSYKDDFVLHCDIRFCVVSIDISGKLNVHTFKSLAAKCTLFEREGSLMTTRYYIEHCNLLQTLNFGSGQNVCDIDVKISTHRCPALPKNFSKKVLTRQDKKEREIRGECKKAGAKKDAYIKGAKQKRREL